MILIFLFEILNTKLTEWCHFGELFLIYLILICRTSNNCNINLSWKWQECIEVMESHSLNGGYSIVLLINYVIIKEFLFGITIKNVCAKFQLLNCIFNTAIKYLLCLNRFFVINDAPMRIEIKVTFLMIKCTVSENFDVECLLIFKAYVKS